MTDAGVLGNIRSRRRRYVHTTLLMLLLNGSVLLGNNRLFNVGSLASWWWDLVRGGQFANGHGRISHQRLPDSRQAWSLVVRQYKPYLRWENCTFWANWVIPVNVRCVFGRFVKCNDGWLARPNRAHDSWLQRPLSDRHYSSVFRGLASIKSFEHFVFSISILAGQARSFLGAEDQMSLWGIVHGGVRSGWHLARRSHLESHVGGFEVVDMTQHGGGGEACTPACACNAYWGQWVIQTYEVNWIETAT
jgi:hypothetical protein